MNIRRGASPNPRKSNRREAIVTKQIQVPDDVYDALVAIAESRGRKIMAGRGSGMVATLREMIELFKPIECGEMNEAWARFNARIMPALNSLALEATRHHERVDISFNVSRGLHLKRIIE
jgi:hypothetical protein